MNPSPAVATAEPRMVVVGSFVQALCWSLPRLPLSGETLPAYGFLAEPAGKGLAVAVGCHRLGLAVDLLLCIGEDAAGDGLLALLRSECLHARYVNRVPVGSGHGAGWVAQDGHNAIAVFPGANALLDARRVSRAAGSLSRAALVYAHFEAPAEAAAAAFSLARRHGGMTVLNPSPWLPPDSALLADTQVLIVNAVEAAQLVPALQLTEAALADQDQTAACLNPLWQAWLGGPERLLVVTLGAAGSMAFGPDGTVWRAPALPVRARNTVGAGDAFAAGWCACRLRGGSVADALGYGNACGAWAAERSGILAGLPRSAELAARVGGGPAPNPAIPAA